MSEILNPEPVVVENYLTMTLDFIYNSIISSFPYPQKSSFENREGTRKLYLIHNIKTFLQKNSLFHLHKSEFFAHCQAAWIFSVRQRLEYFEVLVTIRFMRGNKFTSLTKDLTQENLQNLILQMSSEIETQIVRYSINYLSIHDDLDLKFTFRFNQKKIKCDLREIEEALKIVLKKIIEKNKIGEEQKISQSQFILQQKLQHKNNELNLKTREMCQKSSHPYNIRILQHQTDIQDERQCLYSRETTKNEFKEVKVSGKIEVTTPTGHAQSGQEIKNKHLFLKKPDKEIDGKQLTYLENEKNILEKFKNIIRHSSIGNFYLRKTSQAEGYQNEIFSDIYRQPINKYWEKKCLSRNVNFYHSLRCLFQLIQGLNFFLKNEILHCDIKPKNVLINLQKTIPHVKIIDLEGMLETKIQWDPNILILFSTQHYRNLNYFQNGLDYWKKHNKRFDMYGFGKIVEEIFTPSKPMQNYLNTNYSKFYPKIKQIQKESLKDPHEINFQYEDFMNQVKEIMKECKTK